MLRLSVPAILAATFAAVVASPLAAQDTLWTKDVGPTGACDGHDKASPAFTACIGVAAAAMPDTELFYAGYWLAKSGRYAEALAYLNLARDKDERVLTYIGFATRKLGDVAGALPFYAAALDKNPDFVVARAYLGEAHLTRGEPSKARAELTEIERRCGVSCAAYADLAAQIAAHERGRQG
jgi:tetratricopeptide (TPR) repeat protein